MARTEKWPDCWHEEAAELHRVVALYECLEYLPVALEEHGFGQELGEKHSIALRSVHAHFSIGQAYNFIWRAAKDAAAFYVRESTSRKHATKCRTWEYPTHDREGGG